MHSSRPAIGSSVMLWLLVVGRQRWWPACYLDEAIALQGLRSRARGRDVWPRRKRRLYLYLAPWWLLPKRPGSGSSTSLQRSSDATVSGTTGVAHLGASTARRAVRFSHGRAMARATGGGCGAAAVCGCVAPLSVTTLSVTVACCSRQGWAGDADAVPCAAVIASRHAATQCCENRVAVLASLISSLSRA